MLLTSKRPFLKAAVCTVALLCLAFVARPQEPRPAGPSRAPAAAIGTETLLHQAARAGDLKLLQTRIRQGVNPDARSPSGRTALLEAAAAGQLQSMRILLSAGARVNIASPDGKTPLIAAAEHNHADAVQLLIKANADLDLRSRGLGTALEVSERMGYEQIAEMLRKAGARTFGRSVGDTVCVRPWGGDGYCGVVEAIHKNHYQIRITKIVGCLNGCEPKPECSAGKPVGGPDGLRTGDVITTVSWCLTHTGVEP
ncbi:MAG TPA: ankyrin repeat domain-containing protein [Methylomirabilota bacterium]|nr:ankyrin repeat domain-containing protein [Methylomirabilota bacterium]